MNRLVAVVVASSAVVALGGTSSADKGDPGNRAQEPTYQPPVPHGGGHQVRYYMHGLSTDGKRALLQELGNSSSELHYRSVAVDTGKVLADVDLAALSKFPLETMLDSGGERPGSKPNLADPAIEGDLKKVATLLKDFPLGAGNRIAAHKDGVITAFNVGDQIRMARNGQVGPQLAAQASYGAWMTPDGTSIIYRRHNGKVPGDIVGKYELFVAPIDGKTPSTRIPGTAGVHDTFVMAKGSAVRFVVSSEPQIKTCVVEVSLTKPYTATTKVCLADGERLVNGMLSTTGAWGAFTTVKDLPDDDPSSVTITKGQRRANKQQAFRIRTVNIDTGKIAFDDQRIVSPSAINDDGLMIVDRYRETLLFDSKTKKIERLDQPAQLSSFPKFRTPTELVVERAGSVVVLDTTTWRRAPYRDSP